MADDALTDAITEVLGIHRLHPSLNICTGCAWRATPNAGALADQHEQHRAEQAVQVVREHTAAQVAAAKAEAWERGCAAERDLNRRLAAYHHWSSISGGPPELPVNPYRAEEPHADTATQEDR